MLLGVGWLVGRQNYGQCRVNAVHACVQFCGLVLVQNVQEFGVVGVWYKTKVWMDTMSRICAFVWFFCFIFTNLVGWYSSSSNVRRKKHKSMGAMSRERNSFLLFCLGQTKNKD